MTDSPRPRPRPSLPTSEPRSEPAGEPAGAAGVHSSPTTGSDVPGGGMTLTFAAARSDAPPPARRSATTRARRFVRSTGGRWTIAATVAVAALVLGLLSQGYFSPAAPAVRDAPPAAGGAAEPAVPRASNATAAATTADKPASPADAAKEVRDKIAQLNNPLNNLRAPGEHAVSLSVVSKRPIRVVGYLVPTSVNTNYAFATVKPDRPTFGLRTTALGTGYLAAIFIQADAGGAAVTCRVSVDGKVTDTKTTAGPYGRQVCLG